MGYIDGPEVRAKIKERPLKLDEALDIAIQAAEGLRAAHQKGIVHRDIKSSNLMLSSTGQVKILDFGLAQLTGGTRLTKTDTILGTPAYMSPEQAQRLATDRRTDLWSLGVVLYEMVTGRLPFEGEREQAVLYSIINEPHEPVTALRASVPLELDRILNKALAKKPEGRYQHLDDMLVDLRALRAEPLTGSWVTAVEPNRRKMLWVGGGAAAAALALAAGLNWDRFGGPGAGGTPRIASIAVLPLENFSGDPEQEYFSDGLTENLITELAKVGALKVIARSSTMRYKGSDKPLQEIAGELGVDALIAGSAQRDGDEVQMTAQLIDPETAAHLWSESYYRSVSEVLQVPREVALAIARRIDVTLTPEQQQRLGSGGEVNPEVYEAYLRGMYYVSQNTPEGFERGLKYLHQAVDIDPAEPLAYAGLAEGYITMGHGGGERLDIFPRAKAAAEQALKLDPDRVEAVAALAFVALYHEWDWAKAERLFQRALELNSSLAMTHYHYAWYLALFDRLDEAIAEHKLARDLDPLRPGQTAWLGGLYNFAGQHDEAIAEARKALELNPSFPPSYYVLRLAYSRKGMHEEAIAAARRFAEVSPQIGGKAILGVAYALAGQKEEALKIASEVDQSNRAGMLLFFAPQLYLALGNKDAALQPLELGYEAHFPFLPWIRVRGGEFDDLRDEPRFQDLLRRMNLPL
jgi:TolB-like protein